MTSADLLQIALTLLVLGAVAWVAYRAGQHQAERRALHTISQLRSHLRACTQRYERTSYELSSLRDALRQARVIHPVPPEWMRADD